MRIHLVREPFMCRVGQFEENKRTLCVGIEINALRMAGTYRCYLGANRKTSYEITYAKACEVGQIWVNKSNKQVLILPVTAFDVYKSHWNAEEYHEKEVKRAEVIQERLFGL